MDQTTRRPFIRAGSTSSICADWPCLTGLPRPVCRCRCRSSAPAGTRRWPCASAGPGRKQPTGTSVFHRWSSRAGSAIRIEGPCAMGHAAGSDSTILRPWSMLCTKGLVVSQGGGSGMASRSSASGGWRRPACASAATSPLGLGIALQWSRERRCWGDGLFDRPASGWLVRDESQSTAVGIRWLRRRIERVGRSVWHHVNAVPRESFSHRRDLFRAETDRQKCQRADMARWTVLGVAEPQPLPCNEDFLDARNCHQGLVPIACQASTAIASRRAGRCRRLLRSASWWPTSIKGWVCPYRRPMGRSGRAKRAHHRG